MQHRSHIRRPAPLPAAARWLLPTLLLFAMCTPARAAPTAEEVLQRALAGMGGAAAVDGVRTLIVASETTRREEGKVLTLPTTTYFQYPNSVRKELVLEGKRLALVSTNRGAVMVTPEGNFDLPEDGRLAIELPALRNPVSLLKARNAPKVSFTYKGAAKVGERPVDLLEMRVGPHLMTLGIDTANGRLLRQTYWTNPGYENQYEMEITFSDFREIGNGLVYPFAWRAENQGKLVSESMTTSVGVNEILDPAMFPAPLKAGAAGAAAGR